MDAAPEPSRAPRGGTALLVAIAVATLAGIAASAILVVDYLRPAAVFCGDGGGCDRLKYTSYAAWAGVPTPVLGLVGFAVLGTVALLSGARARLVHAALALASASFAAFLLVVQMQMSTYCRFCIVVDVSALVLAAAAFLRLKMGKDVTGRRTKAGFATSMAIAAAAPMLFGFTRPLPPPGQEKLPVPELVKREMALTPKSQVTVVDFVDFECPFCRMTHAALGPVLQKHAANVRVVRKQVPLKSIHPGAMSAALAACCGEKLGKGDAMADALFSAPPQELTTEGCEAIAARVGLDASAFKACVADPSTTAHVEHDVAEFRGSGGRGLPTIYVDEERFVGAQDPEAIESAILAALKRRG